MDSSLFRLEYHHVLRDISTKAVSGVGQNRVKELRPGWCRETVTRLQAETESAAELVRLNILPPAHNLDNLQAISESINSGTVILSPVQLRNTGMALSEMDRFMHSVEDAEGDKDRYSAISDYSIRIPRLNPLSRKLLNITTPDGELASDASRELARLFKTVDRLKRQLSKRIDRIYTSLSRGSILRDSPPTIRDGRYVLPVISARRGEVKGIVHDRSESGETVFIEPAGLVEEGNALREASLDLDYERRRILRESSLEVRKHSNEINEGIEAVSALDAIYARAQYHIEKETVFPFEGTLSLMSLRHPLISVDEVVRNDVKLQSDWRVLIVSGPNAGGKSVLLKAIGLAVICSQSGIGACVSSGSSIPLFKKILVSMGDQQSIADHQSTYSARLIEQLDMLTNLGKEGLALIDEPAAGTDPLTGAALAASLLEHLADAHCRLIVTTHQGQLKNLAQGKPGFYNGCMNFQKDSLEPDFTFTSGIPGSSFTLEIARKMNFPDNVLARAEELSGDSFRLDRMLEEIAFVRNETAQRLKEIKIEQEQGNLIIERLKMDLESGERDLIRARKKMESEALELERNINSKADALLARLAKAENSSQRREVRAEIREIAGYISTLSVRKDVKGKSSIEDIRPGDWVTVRGWSGKGKVEELSKEHAVIILGNLRLKKPLSDLETVLPPEEEPSSSGWSALTQVRTELDLRGMSADEALAELDSALDDSIATGLPQLRVIHGKGKGILMRAVVECVRNNGRVSSFRQGRPFEGGTGVTIITLDIPEEKHR